MLLYFVEMNNRQTDLTPAAMLFGGIWSWRRHCCRRSCSKIRQSNHNTSPANCNKSVFFLPFNICGTPLDKAQIPFLSTFVLREWHVRNSFAFCRSFSHSAACLFIISTNYEGCLYNLNNLFSNSVISVFFLSKLQFATRAVTAFMFNRIFTLAIMINSSLQRSVILISPSEEF